MQWRATIALVVAALTSVVSACEKPEDRVRDGLAEFEAEARRLHWSCDAMGHGLGIWLDRNEEELAADVRDVASRASSLDSDEQKELFDSLAPNPNNDARAALVHCADNERVVAALERLNALMRPVHDVVEP